MINKFIIDTARIHQQTIAIQQNGASACYDRIIANHASINSRREGTPKRVCKLRANTLHSTNFHIQTSLGTSKESYSHQQYPYFWLVSVPLDLVAMDCCIAEIKFLFIKFLGIADFVFYSIILKVGYPGRCV